MKMLLFFQKNSSGQLGHGGPKCESWSNSKDFFFTVKEAKNYIKILINGKWAILVQKMRLGHNSGCALRLFF